MTWKKGKRRQQLDLRAFASAVASLSSISAAARAVGISERQMRRIISGEHWCSLEVAERLAEFALSTIRSHALPRYDTDMAIDGYTRVGGVSEYSIRAARGDMRYVSDAAAWFSEE